MSAPDVSAARVYDVPPRGKSRRFLVDRLWPRGLRKEEAPFSTWLRDVAPSPELRKWYGHEPARFEEFAKRYRAELRRSPGREALEELRRATADGPLVVVTATRDLERSGAAVLTTLLRGERGRR